jgi:putative acetyltransferase
VVVLGHEKYYPRFGFQRASKYGLKSQWAGVPGEAFMAMILDASAMEDVSGVVRYGDEFSAAM